MISPGPVRRGPAGPRSTGVRAVALGGGHGLAATLRALRRVTDDVTAVVGVSDDGGSSGRLREEFDVVPPGDLRMALAALCGDDTWGRTWSRVVQHRFAGSGDLAGHSLGNLLITALWEETGDIVTGLDWVGALLGAHGRVLPVATAPLQVVADVAGLHPEDPSLVERVVGQVQVATTRGQVVGLRVEPADTAACPAAVEAITDAEAIVLGPGSWFTSVLAPLQVRGIGQAVADSGGASSSSSTSRRSRGRPAASPRSATSRSSPRRCPASWSTRCSPTPAVSPTSGRSPPPRRRSAPGSRSRRSPAATARRATTSTSSPPPSAASSPPDHPAEGAPECVRGTSGAPHRVGRLLWVGVGGC